MTENIFTLTSIGVSAGKAYAEGILGEKVKNGAKNSSKQFESFRVKSTLLAATEYCCNIFKVSSNFIVLTFKCFSLKWPKDDFLHKIGMIE